MSSTRRTFLTSAAAGTIALIPTGVQAAREWTAAEKANVQVVNAFCASWANGDVENLTSFMSEDCSVRLSDTQPPAKGRPAVRAVLNNLFTRIQKVDIEVTDTFAIGPTVLNDRQDYITRDGKRTPVRVAGFFLLKDGKITEWTDYLVRS